MRKKTRGELNRASSWALQPRRGGMGTEHAAPMGLFFHRFLFYKHAAPDGAGAATAQASPREFRHSRVVAVSLLVLLLASGCMTRSAANARAQAAFAQGQQAGA